MRWLLLVALVPRFAAAEPRLLGDDTFATHSEGDLALDGGLLVGMPAALPSGISSGFGLGVTRGCGCHFAYGVRAGWSTVTESSLTWTVSQSDYRLRAIGAVRHSAGRGTLELRLGIGTTIVHEVRVETQSMRLPDPKSSRAIAALPAADLDAVIALHVTGPWLAMVSAGPTFDVLDGHLHAGFTAQLGVAWQP